MLAAVALALGLAMDATAVCAARALGAGAGRERWLLPALFGAAQASMAAIGWLGGSWARAYIAEVDHWIAGGLLLAIGVHMAVEAWRGEAEDEPRPGSLLLYLGLAIATSIDAAAAGLTLPLLPVTPALSLGLIGGITTMCCLAGFAGGRALGDRFGARLGVLGGLVLIGIAIDIMVRAP